jgi:hypothetical protein
MNYSLSALSLRHGKHVTSFSSFQPLHQQQLCFPLSLVPCICNIRNQTQSSAMSTAREFANPAVVEAQQQQVADAIKNVRDQINETPEHPVPVTKVVQWFIDVITSIITLIELIAMSYARRIMDIETTIRANPTSTRATASTSTPSAPSTSRLKRCIKCPPEVTTNLHVAPGILQPCKSE